ncbi:TPA: peptidase, partial [Streptococcus pyogenes]|nr:peptidase [Streptococcus pyogenes]
MKKLALLTLFSTTLLVSAPIVSFADETASSSDINILADDDPVVPVEPTDPTTPVDPVDPVDPV